MPTEGEAPRVHLDTEDRTHLDLWTVSEDEQSAESERLIALGDVRIDCDYPDDADFVVQADPDGHPFCVINSNA